MYVKFVCVIIVVVCVREAAGEGAGGEGTRDTESKTRTPHKDVGKKRVGKPRQNWLHHTKRFVYEQVLGYHNFDEHTDNNCVYAAAMSRSF